MLQQQTKEYWESRLSKDYSLGGVGYFAIGKEYNYWIYRMRKRQFNKLLKRFRIPSSASCLDIGSGTGFYIQQLLKQGYENMKEISSKTIEISRK